jgi:hypothetical protein
MQLKLRILGISSVVVLLMAAIFPPIAQPIAYHQFADQEAFLGLPNFLNVFSNLAIFLSGMVGLLFVLQSYRSPVQRSFINKTECWPYLVVFLSVVMTGFGSAYYHWAPDNASLLWDRLPIALGVTALLAAALVERVGLSIGLWALPLLVVLGVASVMYWHWTEQQGAGNLNFYIVVQFYSLLLIVLLSAFFPSNYTRGGDIYKVIALYVVAKVAETFDREIYDLGQVISGHTIKHLLAAVAIYLIVRMLQKRAFIPKSQ